MCGTRESNARKCRCEHCYRQVCFMLASRAVAEVMKAASKLFSCQKGGESDLQ